MLNKYLVFISLNAQLLDQDVFGHDQTHLGVAQTQILSVIIHALGV